MRCEFHRDTMQSPVCTVLYYLVQSINRPGTLALLCWKSFMFSENCCRGT